MLRQFETRSSARPTAAALQRARLQEKKHYRDTAINTARMTVPKRIIAQTMIPNPQSSRQTNQGPYIEIKFFNPVMQPEGHMCRFLYKNIKFHIEKQSFYTVMQSESHMHRYNFVVKFY
jgi:hypothetical protein